MNRILVFAALLTLSATSFVSPAHAVGDEESAPTTTGAPGSVESREILEDLSGQQSSKLIQETVNSGLPVEVLIDSNTGEYLVVVVNQQPVSPVFTTAAVSPVGPGCSSSSACIVSNGEHSGYQGTGTLKGTWKKTSAVRDMSLQHRTRFYWSGSSIVPEPGVTIHFNPTVTVTKLVRTKR